MFTKYNGITPPQNYSGSRFKPSPNDTEMKTHKAPEPISKPPAIKTALSPTFQESVNRIAEPNEAYSYDEQAQETTRENPAEFEDEKSEIIDTPPRKASREVENPLGEFLSKSGVGKLLNSLHSDDILLLALILFLAEENNKDSNDAILILALLLMYR